MNHSEITTQYTKDLSILFVEDHEELRENTINILESIFKNVDSASNGLEALEKYKEFHDKTNNYYDIVLSDINMPIMNGIELTSNLYKIKPEQIVIILSAHDEKKYLLKLINLGVQQFIQKPIDFQELLNSFYGAAKKLQNIGKTKPDQSKIMLCKDMIYNKESKSVTDNGQEIYLTKFEIIFLELLSTFPGKIFSNEEIVSHYNSVDEQIDGANIRKMVSKLRKKIQKETIESVYGVGYKLIPYYEDDA
jgi:DNA-binding response OmpR family regulator